MRFAAFLEELGRTPHESSRWAAVAFEFSAVRLVERWFEGETVDAIRTAFGDLLRADRLAIAEPLRSIVRIIETSPRSPSTKRRVSGALIRLTVLLTHQGRWGAAREVATLTLRHCDRRLMAIRWHALRARGATNRLLGDLDQAESDYRRCIRLGKTRAIPAAVAWGRTGITKILTARGNLAAAERHARCNLKVCRATRRDDLVAMAMHDLGVVVGTRGRIDESLYYFKIALRRSRRYQRDRVAHDVAMSLLTLGRPHAARKIFETLIASGAETFLIVTAHINLIELYATLAQRDAVERHRRVLESMILWPDAEMSFRLALGQALLTLGDSAAALPHLRRADDLGTNLGFGQVAIEADAALSRAIKAARRPSSVAEGSGSHDSILETVRRVYAHTP